MKLSTSSQHAIMAMLALAVHEDEGAVRLHDLAQQQGISLSYLEQVFARLRANGLVEGIRGPGGGYRLSRPVEDITLADIAQAVEDNGVSQRLSGHREQQMVQTMWEEFSAMFYDFLNGITLESLLEGHRLPRKPYQMGETASLIARMFPARLPAGLVVQPAL